jgi:hypothetical protein
MYKIITTAWFIPVRNKELRIGFQPYRITRPTLIALQGRDNYYAPQGLWGGRGRQAIGLKPYPKFFIPFGNEPRCGYPPPQPSPNQPQPTPQPPKGGAKRDDSLYPPFRGLGGGLGLGVGVLQPFCNPYFSEYNIVTRKVAEKRKKNKVLRR